MNVNNGTTVEKINGYFKDEYTVQNDFLCAEQLGPTNRERGFSGSTAPNNGGSIDCMDGTDHFKNVCCKQIHQRYR